MITDIAYDTNPNIITKKYTVERNHHGNLIAFTVWVEQRTMPTGSFAYVAKRYPEHHKLAGRVFLRQSKPFAKDQDATCVVDESRNGKQIVTPFRNHRHAMDWMSDLIQGEN